MYFLLYYRNIILSIFKNKSNYITSLIYYYFQEELFIFVLEINVALSRLLDTIVLLFNKIHYKHEALMS